MHIDTSLPTAIGCKVSGIDGLTASPDEIRQIKDLLYQYKIIVLKGQNLSEKQFCDLSARLGLPIPYLQENYHHPNYPLIFVSSNILQNGKKFGVARTGGYWHSDTSFLQEPVALTMLYPQVIPIHSHRTTLYIDLEKALNDMPTRLRSRIENCRFIHSGKWKYKVRETDVGLDLSEILGIIHQVQPPVIHPAIIRHPVTGSEVLFVSRGFTIGIEGKGTDESKELLDEVFDFVEQACFISEFQWELGDIIIWDNRFLTHKAGRLAQANDPVNGDISKEEDTMVYRIIVRDGFPLCANLPPIAHVANTLLA
ncbi:MAG: TauD/TfdA family dioxygenase [Candidatus Thiodiazotropha sp.]|jgi:taurine dioxygenase